jgi:hypothetical protein
MMRKLTVLLLALPLVLVLAGGCDSTETSIQSSTGDNAPATTSTGKSVAKGTGKGKVKKDPLSTDGVSKPPKVRGDL